MCLLHLHLCRWGRQLWRCPPSEWQRRSLRPTRPGRQWRGGGRGSQWSSSWISGSRGCICRLARSLYLRATEIKSYCNQAKLSVITATHPWIVIKSLVIVIGIAVTLGRTMSWRGPRMVKVRLHCHHGLTPPLLLGQGVCPVLAPRVSHDVWLLWWPLPAPTVWLVRVSVALCSRSERIWWTDYFINL